MRWFSRRRPMNWRRLSEESKRKIKMPCRAAFFIYMKGKMSCLVMPALYLIRKRPVPKAYKIKFQKQC